MKRRLHFSFPLEARRDYRAGPPFYATTPDGVLADEGFAPFDNDIFWSMAARTSEATDFIQVSKVCPEILISNDKYK